MTTQDEYDEAQSSLYAYKEYLRLCDSHGGNDQNHSNYEHTLKVIENTKIKIAKLEILVADLKQKLADQVL